MNTTKFKYPMNLQLFAVNANGVDEDELDDADQDADESEDNQDDSEIEHEFADDDTDSDEDEDDAEQDDDAVADEDDSADDDQDDKTSQKDNKAGKGNNNPTAKAVMAERKKWQAKMDQLNKSASLATKIMHLSGATSIEDMQRRIDEVEANNLAAQSGITPEKARSQIAERREIDDMKQQIQDQKYALEFQTLKKDPFYSDIDNYKEEYQEIASRTGMSLEEVYLSKRGRERMKERETEIASRVNANKDKRQSKKVNTSSSGGANGGGGNKSSSKKLNLTPEQRQAAEYGVKKGHFKTIEEYAKYL